MEFYHADLAPLTFSVEVGRGHSQRVAAWGSIKIPRILRRPRFRALLSPCRVWWKGFRFYWIIDLIRAEKGIPPLWMWGRNSFNKSNRLAYLRSILGTTWLILVIKLNENLFIPSQGLCHPPPLKGESMRSGLMVNQRYRWQEGQNRNETSVCSIWLWEMSVSTTNHAGCEKSVGKHVPYYYWMWLVGMTLNG